ncbi:hypothetical protein FQN50_006185 [Emmonsiellopsis sp. PD_5]|nr:hypothetical protein FQN50_006185 [Emmonsiellopsis sp. PD_5]
MAESKISGIDRPYLRPIKPTYYDDGREIKLLHYVFGLPNLEEIRGSPSKVLEAIDEFGRTKQFMINVGTAKGAVVTDLIAKVKPETMVELGGYVGYSAILFGDAVRRAGGRKYYSLETNPEFVAVQSMMLELAGLRDFVEIILGPGGVSLRKLWSSGSISRIDLLFLDHDKPAYVPDLKLCEQLGLVTVGSVIAADNMITPGNPEYIRYVRSSVAEKRKAVADTSTSDDNDMKDNMSGNPNLIYESVFVDSFEPSGVPVSTTSSILHVRSALDLSTIWHGILTCSS